MKSDSRIISTFVLTAVLLLLGIGLSFWYFEQSHDSADARKSALLAIASAESVLSKLKDAEVGKRDYLLTGDDMLLAPYRSARASLGETLKTMRQVSLSPASQVQLDKLAPLINDKLNEMAEVIALRRDQGEAAAVALLKSGHGRDLMDSIRKEVSGFKQLQDAALEQNDDLYQSNMRRLFIAIIASSFFSVSYALLFAYLFYRQTRQRLRSIVHGKTLKLLKTQKDTNNQLQQSFVTLKASEEDFHALVIATTQVVWKASPDGSIEASPTWCQFTGQTAEEMVGMGWLEAVHPDDRAEVRQAWEQAVAALKPLHSEHLVRNSHGEYRYCLFSGVPVLHADGSLRTWIGTLKDVTERKTAEDALRESERRYYTLYNSIDEGYCIIEMIFDSNQKPVDYLFLEVNASFEKQTGLKDATSKRARQLVPNLEPFWFEVYGNVALTGEAIRFEHHAEDIGGRCFDAYAFKLGGPESRKVAVIFSDITQRKHAERLLRESDQRLHLATEATGAGIWEWNVVTGAIKWDAQMFRIYGVAPTPDGMVEYDQWAKCLLGEDLPQQEAILQDTVRQQGHSKREFRIIRPDDKACRHIQSAEATRSNEQGQVEWVVGTNLDITESKLADVELRESETRYRRLFEAANDGVLLLDPTTRKITDANPFMTRLLGYAREQLIGKELYEIGLLKDETASQSMFEQLKIDHNVRYENLPLESQEGRHKEVEVVANLYDEDGLSVIQCNIRDITERKLAGDALRENEERYRALVEATATAVWRTTPDGSVVFASDNWNKITGQTEEQKRGWGWLDAIHPDDREPTITRWKYSLETQTVHENEFRVRTAAGEYRWFGIRAVPIFNSNGEVREWVGANTDINDRKQGVDELENSRQRLRLAMDAAGLTYVEVDLISGGIRIAENFSAVMGFTTPAEEQVEVAFGTDLLLDHVDPADRDRLAQALEQFVTGKPSGTVEYRVRGDDNITRYIETNWSVEREVNGQPQKSFATNLDITERKKTEEVVLRNNNDLKLAKAAAEKANLAKSDFLSNMSHELRTPLGAILGFAQLIETSEPPPTATQKRSVDQILQAGWYLLDLINEILDLSVVESGRLTISMEPVSLANVMLECRDMIDPQAMTRGISVTFSSLDVPHWVQADPTRLKQVLINLLSNAIKYNKVSGTVEVDCKLVAPQTVRVFVRDSGFGLNEEQLSQLFQPFNRLGRQTGKEEGAGIGLVVSKRLVELMGGKIGVESTIGKGCVFWFDLNLAPAPEIAGNKTKMKLATDSLVSAGPHKHSMLYVEDNPANLQLVEGILERRSDIRLLSAKNANRGIEIARNARPDIILMDINLPGINGYQALNILAQDPTTAHIPVIAISANAMSHNIEKGLKAGFFRYLTKPIKIDEFMDTVDAALHIVKTKSTNVNNEEIPQ